MEKENNKEVVRLEIVKLSDFLKENNCYEEFINNFDKDYRYENWKRGDSGSIVYAFEWRSTKEGSAYWDTLHIKYGDIKHKENDLINYFEVTEDNEVTSEVTRLQKKITNLQHSLSKKDGKIKNQALEISSLLSQKQHLQQQLNSEVSVKEKYSKSLIIIEYLENKLRK